MVDSKTKIIPAKRLEELRAESREIDIEVVFDETSDVGVPADSSKDDLGATSARFVDSSLLEAARPSTSTRAPLPPERVLLPGGQSGIRAPPWSPVDEAIHALDRALDPEDVEDAAEGALPLDSARTREAGPVVLPSEALTTDEGPALKSEPPDSVPLPLTASKVPPPPPRTGSGAIPAVVPSAPSAVPRPAGVRPVPPLPPKPTSS